MRSLPGSYIGLREATAAWRTPAMSTSHVPLPTNSGVTGSPGDYNWGGAYGTWFWVDPKEEMTTVFMAHAPGPTRLHYRRLLTTLVNQAIID